MLPADFVHELRTAWLPNVSDAGLERVIDLLEKGSPLLLSGRFTGAAAMGSFQSRSIPVSPATRRARSTRRDDFTPPSPNRTCL